MFAYTFDAFCCFLRRAKKKAIPATINIAATAPMAIPAIAPPEILLDVDDSADGDGVGEESEASLVGVDVAVDPVEEEDEDEDEDGVAVAPRVAATCISPAFPQQLVVSPQHHVLDVGVPSHGVILMFPASGN